MEPARAVKDSSSSRFCRAVASSDVGVALDDGSTGNLGFVPFFLCTGVCVGAGFVGFDDSVGELAD